ncbi:PAS domain-containing protein [Sphingomicrobium lutaoense]|uniref:histidine kinase n=1 Tax=Sphingomicrobium lutaoense TaxID=515949 RepID=A0A839Z163_9SPHN|nr:PAS domain-containing protein [Sphingomicrobium lutaoense]MBB3763315.1 PAS domain S-box-containing protein [Sphingomicrobium lutaoense]
MASPVKNPFTPASAQAEPQRPWSPGDELHRLQILDQHELHRIEDDPILNEITSFAAKLCDAPIALVSLVEEARQRFLSRQGVEVGETARSASFCQYAMIESDVMEVSDATKDGRFAHTELVMGDPNIRFYAGAPLTSEEGAPMGALCVISPETRAGLTDFQREGLRVLSHAVINRLNMHRHDILRERRQAEVENVLGEGERRFRTLADAIPHLAWSASADGLIDYYNLRWYERTGGEGQEHYGLGWLELVHPDEKEALARQWSELIAKGEPFDVEFRLRDEQGEYRWVLGRGLPIRGENGRISRWFGTTTDIHRTRLLLESQELLSRELSHRIKNIFSVVAGLVNYFSRSYPEVQGVSQILADRIAALGRAHNYVRPGDKGANHALPIKGLLGDIFAPYSSEQGPRIRVEGEDFDVGERAVTPIALAFHELATNAVKYGALSIEGGHVDLGVSVSEEQVRLDWEEKGGPAVVAPPERKGFGSDLVAMSIERQLRGKVRRDWSEEGLAVTVSLPKEQLK